MRVGGGFSLEALSIRPAKILLRVSGAGAWEAFRYEGGGHRWQRVPPMEKRGRVHSSTVTVAVMQEISAAESPLDLRDVVFETYRGSGPGGQHRNTSDTAVKATHRPTGITAC